MVARPRETGERSEIIMPEISESAFDVIFDSAYEGINDFEDADQIISFLDLGIRLQLTDEHEIKMEKPDIAHQIRLICCEEEDGFNILKDQERLKEILKPRLSMFGILRLRKSRLISEENEQIRETFTNAQNALTGARRTLKGVISSIPPARTTENEKIFGISLKIFKKIHAEISSTALTFLQDLANKLAKSGMQISENEIKEALIEISLKLSETSGVQNTQSLIRKNPKKLWELLIFELRKF